MAQTAVSALMESIFGSDFRLTVSDDILNKYQISVEMEKQQMIHFGASLIIYRMPIFLVKDSYSLCMEVGEYLNNYYKAKQHDKQRG